MKNIYVVMARWDMEHEFCNVMATYDVQESISEYNRMIESDEFDEVVIEVLVEGVMSKDTTMLKGYHDWNLDYCNEIEVQ